MDDAFDAGRLSAWGPSVEGSLAFLPDPRVALTLEVGRHALEGGADPLADPPAGTELPEAGAAAWSAALHLVAAPLGGSRPVEPTLQFGLERFLVDDGEDRSVAFVSGAGIRARVGARWSARLDVRNHYLTIREDDVDGVETGRDASLWEARAGLGWRIGGSR